MLQSILEALLIKKTDWGRTNPYVEQTNVCAAEKHEELTECAHVLLFKDKLSTWKYTHRGQADSQLHLRTVP